MALHFPKISIKNVVKRSCALLAALCIALYSLITAPLFGVHAVDSSDITNFINAAIDWGYDSSSKLIDNLSQLPIPGSGAVSKRLQCQLDLAYNWFRADGYGDQAISLLQDITNSGNFNEINISSVQGISGYYVRGGSTRSVSVFTHSQPTIDLNTSILLISCEDYALYLQLVPLNGLGKEDYTNLQYSETVNYYGSFTQFQTQILSISSQPFSVKFILFANGDYTTKTSNISTYNFNYFRYIYRNRSESVVLPDSSASLFNYLVPSLTSSTTGAYIGGTSTASYPFDATYMPAFSTDIITGDNIYNYYERSVYPQIIEEFPDITFNSPQYYYETIITPTDPTEPNTGTTGGVIIIDPFTLPPEWLEDNAELGTSHYELDSEQWEDPLEIIKAYKHADPSGQIPSGAVTDDGSFEGPADVVEAMEAFTDYAYMILTESGLLWVVASLVSVGLIVRLFTLK